jgi:hypothetical protein
LVPTVSVVVPGTTTLTDLLDRAGVRVVTDAVHVASNW